MFKKAAFALIAVLFSHLPAAADSLCDAVVGNIVKNCGFESGSLAGWDVTGNAGVSSVHTDSGAWAAALGLSAIVPNNVGTISQTLSTIAGETYLLTFWYMTDTGGTFTASWNSLPVFPTVTTNPTVFTMGQFLLTATGNDVLSFTGITIPDPGKDTWFVDDVSVVRQQPRPVTEPTTVVLLGIGLIGIVLYQLQRRRN